MPSPGPVLLMGGRSRGSMPEAIKSRILARSSASVIRTARASSRPRADRLRRPRGSCSREWPERSVAQPSRGAARARARAAHSPAALRALLGVRLRPSRLPRVRRRPRDASAPLRATRVGRASVQRSVDAGSWVNRALVYGGWLLAVLDLLANVAMVHD